MKNIKNLSIFFLAISFAFISCDDTGETLDIDANLDNSSQSGAITTLTGTSGKLLGNAIDPTDLENSEVILSDDNAELTLKLSLEPGSIAKNVAKYEIVKSLNNGNEVVVAETTNLPFDLTLNTVDEMISGLDVATSDLRIGDQINFLIKVYTDDGKFSYQGANSSKFSVTVNCASDLAGAYNLRVITSNGLDVSFPNEMITEVTPGYYKTTSIYRWAVGSIAPDQGFNFNDVCGTLTAPEQGLAQGYYSNKVYSFEPGSVDTNTGNLVINYIVEFASGNVECIATYTKL